MKKISLLLALAIFGFGSATIVNAEMGTETSESQDLTSETEGTEEVTNEEVVFDPADINQDGIVSEDEQAAYDAGTAE